MFLIIYRIIYIFNSGLLPSLSRRRNRAIRYNDSISSDDAVDVTTSWPFIESRRTNANCFIANMQCPESELCANALFPYMKEVFTISDYLQCTVYRDVLHTSANRVRHARRE